MNAATRALNPGVFAQDEPPFIPPARTNAGFTGKDFEKEIEQTAGAYNARRVARLQKVDPPVAVIWVPDAASPGKKRQRVIFKRNPWLDFAGVWSARGGLALLVECKSTSTHRLGLREGQLGPDQVAALKNWRLAGAATCVLWRFNDRCALFTPEMLLAAEARGDKSLVFENGLPVAPGEGTVRWDFLPTLERALWPDCSTVEQSIRRVRISLARVRASRSRRVNPEAVLGGNSRTKMKRHEVLIAYVARYVRASRQFELKDESREASLEMRNAVAEIADTLEVDPAEVQPLVAASCVVGVKVGRLQLFVV